MQPPKVIISGGGTGGHVFPAIAIADAIRQVRPDADLLFVGALGRLEMERVPAAGYPIEGLDIAGVQRRVTWKNLLVPVKLVKSILKSHRILRQFKPQVAVGVGGYASGPLLRAAASRGIPYVVQEQNSYPGVTNKLLSRHAHAICVAYEGMEKWFPKEKIILTGNPVRSKLAGSDVSRAEAAAAFGLDPLKPVLLVIGGSLGARTINESIEASLPQIASANVQLLWQTGKPFAERATRAINNAQRQGLTTLPFIDRMDLAYAIANVVVSRAGAMSVSELCMVAKPTIFVPSPNVAEDHQTKNAQALVSKGAALLVADADAKQSLVTTALELLAKPERCTQLQQAMAPLARPNAAADIAREVLKLIPAQG
jgi:UDP-N-acetylglucosamine--N-acetylmuramyl-(pentapeptide) pyrophosphoryl-undecaprenol N-acetylglucosamine transferase